MTQPTDREVKSLLTEVEIPEPPADLAARIKSEIPADLSSGRFEGTDLEVFDAPRRSPSRGWLIAASLVVAVGGGLIALRQMDQFQTPAGALESGVVASEAAASDAVAPESVQYRSPVDQSLDDAELETVLVEEIQLNEPLETRSSMEAKPDDSRLQEKSTPGPDVTSADKVVVDEVTAGQAELDEVSADRDRSDRTRVDQKTVASQDLPSPATRKVERSEPAPSRGPQPKLETPSEQPQPEAPGEQQTRARQRADSTGAFEKRQAAQPPQAPATVESTAVAAPAPVRESARLEDGAADRSFAGARAGSALAGSALADSALAGSVLAGSYQQVRSALSEGRWPAPEAIRRAEIVLGFGFGGPEAESKQESASPADRFTILVDELVEILERRQATESELEHLLRRSRALATELDGQPAVEELVVWIEQIGALVESAEER